MAVNLRLAEETADALRAEAKRTGRSQQDLLREAVDQYLRLTRRMRVAAESEALVESGVVWRPRREYRKVMPRRAVPAGVNSLDLFDRDDRDDRV